MASMSIAPGVSKASIRLASPVMVCALPKVTFWAWTLEVMRNAAKAVTQAKLTGFNREFFMFWLMFEM